MDDQTLTILAGIPLFIVVISWGIFYRRSVLRIRYMALSGGFGLFISLVLISAYSGELIDNLLVAGGISVLFGGSILLWWPILGWAFRRHSNVRW